MSDKINTLFAEKYRPQTLDEFIGNSQLISRFKSYIEDKDFPHLLLTGKAGGGKTTLAKLLVNQIGCDYIYINASDENNVDTIRYKVKNFSTAVSFNDLIRVVILDEADYMTPNAQAALRNLMETTSKYTRFILTGNYVNRIIEPISSRCTHFEIKPLAKGAVAKRLDEILKLEKIKHTVEDLVPIINAHFPDLRKTLNELQRCIKDGKLIVDEKQIIESDYKLKIIDLLKDKNISKNSRFVEIRKLILNNDVQEFSDLYSLLYDNIDELFDTDNYVIGKKADAIIVLSEQQYQDAFVIDKEITFAATIIKLLNIMFD